jgi:thiamine transport system permease protein
MDRHRQPITLPLIVGIGLALAAALGCAAVYVFVLLLSAGGDTASAPWAYIWNVLGFTLYQAVLSTFLALLGAVPMTRALARRSDFAGRMLLVRLCALPMVMPTIVGIFGIVAVYGGNGYLAAATGLIGLEWQPRIYGLVGILLAHVFFNLPLAIRLLLPAYAAIPAETWRLAAQLRMEGGDIFRIIEWPLLRQRLPAIALVIFMLCFTTFAIALTLGGGPRATTLEVAIYQALRFDFDLRLGAVLALLQAACCAAGAWAVWRLGHDMVLGQTAHLIIRRHDGQGRAARVWDGAVLVTGALFLALPLLALVQRGVAGLPAAASAGSLLSAALVSLGLGLGGGLLATIIGYATAQARQYALAHGRHRWALLLGLVGRMGLFVSPMVIGTGIFLAAAGHIDLYRFAAIGVVTLSAMMALPFVLSVLEPALANAAERHDKLCAALGIKGWHRFLEVDWPTLRKPIATALALSSVIAMGDLGAIALFGHQDMVNLTLLLYGQLGAYRLDGAAATALVLLLLALGFYWVIERWVGGRELH